MIDDDIIELFREEAQEQLANLETSLLNLDSADAVRSRRGLIDDAFRHAHNLRGSARAVGLREIQSLGETLENTLDIFRDDPDSVTTEAVAQAFGELGTLRAAFRRWEADGGTNPHQASANEAEATLELIADEEILGLFREESREHVAALESSLLDLENADDLGERRNIIDNVFRHAHSLKGASRAVGLTEVQDLAQTLEDTLDVMREKPDALTKAATDRALAEFDALHQAYDRWNGTEAGDSSSEQTVTSATDETPPSAGKGSRAAKTTEDRFVVRVPAERLDRMLSLAGEVRVSQRGGDSLESQIDVLGELLANTLATFKNMEDKPSRVRNASPTDTGTAPLDQLYAPLEGAVERLRQLQSDFGKKRFREDLLVEALEQDIRTARLVPLANLTESLRRAVRDLVQSLGKSINYEPDVGDTLLDKAVMESLKDPLMHLIRNAVDHGIESPEQRVAAGKSKTGTISITASRRADSVLIRVTDDGGGINFNLIREKLQQQGNLEQSDILAFSEQDLARVLFQAGFTTKQEATSVSGRGVGMDVVLDAIHRLQGTVELECSSPAGTSFMITVPVTISTARILTVTSCGQQFGIPTAALVRTGRVLAESLRDLEGSLILTVDGHPVRWVDLSDLLGASIENKSPQGNLRPYLLLCHESRKLALAVDEFEDESEVILKSLEFPLAEIPAMIGGTIRPDGAVQLVLDPSWVISKALQVSKRVEPLETERVAQILVVDDSPTTRSILRNVLAAAGYAVQTASDGVEAVDRLRTQPFDLVVSDVEMPRMNGFELTRQVKTRFQVPVILITGLEKEDDLRQGLEAGADAYLVKSTFEDKGLLDVVQQLV